jgi:transposase
MLMYSRLPFKTKYPEPPKGAISTGSMLFCMFWMEPVPVTRLGLYGDSPRAVEYWIQRLTSKGLSGLLDGNHPGRPTRLSVSNLADLRKDISRNPRELGYDQNLWDGLLLSHHLIQKYSISLGIRQCQRLFHQLGFSLQRPRRKASEADGPRQEAFKKTTTS